MNSRPLSVLWLIPGKKDSPLDMLFAKRGISYLGNNGVQVTVRMFYETKSIFGILREVFKLRRFVSSQNIDLIHSQFGSTTSFVALLTGLPFVITFRGTDLNGDPASNPLVNFMRFGMGLIAAHFSKAVIFVSSGLRHKLGYAASRSAIIPSGTEVELFVPMSKLIARETLGINKNKFYIGFASGGRRKLKRFDLAEEVRNQLAARGYEVEILEIWNVAHGKVPLYINASDVVILTSEREGSPNIIRESLACGVPVVSFDVGDANDWIQLDKFSSLVPIRNTNLI